MRFLISDFKNVYPFVSVIVPTFNSERTLRECLTSLFSQDYPSDRYEVIVVDGYSNDRTVQIAREFPVKILFESRLTRAAACKLGVEYSLGEYVAFTDSDCCVSSRWLRNLILPLANNGSVAAIGGPNRFNPNISEITRIVAFLTKTSTFAGNTRISKDYHKMSFTDSTNGCNCAYKKSVILALGNFEPRAIGAEEIELEWRIANAGYTILYTPYAEVVHNKYFNVLKFVKWLYRLGKDRANVTKLRWIQIIKTRKLRPICPPMVLLAVFSPLAFAGLLLSNSICAYNLSIIVCLFASYMMITVYTIIQGFRFLRSWRLAIKGGCLQIIGHIAFIIGWWAHLLGLDKAGTSPKRC